MNGESRTRTSSFDCRTRLLPFLLAALLPKQRMRGRFRLESDFSLGLDEYTKREIGSRSTGNVDGVFGPHRCQCPENLSPVLQLTSTGQTDIGSSTIGVTFYRETTATRRRASCTSLGQASFTASEGASPPTFSSNAVFEAAAGSASPSCTA